MLHTFILTLSLTMIRANYDPEDVQPEIKGVFEKSQACGYTEVFYQCRPCDLICGQDQKLCPIKDCQEGCGCPPNFRRNVDGDCVEYFNCFSNLRPKSVRTPALLDSTTEIPYSRLHYQRVFDLQPKITIGQKINRSALPPAINVGGNDSPIIRTQNLNSQAHHHKSSLSNGFPTRFNPTVSCEEEYFPFRSELECLKFFNMKSKLLSRRSRSL